MSRILIVRGDLVTPWELRPWLALPERFEVRCLLTASNRYRVVDGIDYVRVGSWRDRLPPGRLADAAIAVIGNRYRDADEVFAWADVVHSEELSFWFASEAARRHRSEQFALVQTVWETLPMLESFRNRRAREHRRRVLAETDLFLPATERAALGLRLEGVAEERIRVCPPGIDSTRFAVPAPAPPAEHVLISTGRLVWEKGHQDAMRALALLHRGLVRPADGRRVAPTLRIVGAGPEEARLRRYADELGIGASVAIGGVPYDEMPAVFASASAMILASQASASAALHPLGIPRAFWEEQFGLVLAEAMASGLDIVTTTSGAIPEVLRGTDAHLVAPGDWPSIARVLADGPLSRAPGERVPYPSEVVERYSTEAAASRLAAVYDDLG